MELSSLFLLLLPSGLNGFTPKTPFGTNGLAGGLLVLLRPFGSDGLSFKGGLEDVGLVITNGQQQQQQQQQQHNRFKRRVKPKAVKEYDGNAAKKETNEKGKEKKKYWRLEHDVKIRGEIRSRYAMTLVENVVVNTEEVDREVFFTLLLPETAFISKFALEVDGQVFLAEVKEKSEALSLYKDAVEQGKSAGHVGMSARHSNKFKVSVNTPAKGTVRFYLLYEELLRRKNGFYSYIINISPHQKLSDYRIEVNILEEANITRLTVPSLRNHLISDNKPQQTEQLKHSSILLSPSESGSAKVTYTPNIKHLQDKVKEGPLQFVLEYEVERLKAGQLQLYQGYFVHFVAPEHLPPMPKHVVFVLDTSGSMKNRKMQQTVNAMKTILGEMRDKDYITILRFSDSVSVWEVEDDSIVSASKLNRQLAIDFVSGLSAGGETNINSALVKALTIVTHVQQKGVLNGVQSMVFFLTDGHPTKGVTDTKQILENVRSANKEAKAAIFSLAFGVKTDFGMLKTLSIQNFGFARKIYTAADAHLQLEGLYKEVSSPILSNVEFNYLNSTLVTESVTETVFHSFYQGGEMIVAGVLDPAVSTPEIQYQITAVQTDGLYSHSGEQFTQIIPISETVDSYIDFLPDKRIEYNFLERLWAYLTVQDLFVKLAKGELVSCEQPRPLPNILEPDFEGEGDGVIICNNLQRALYLSLRYQFVTPLTSLVVVKPDTRENGEFAEADKFKDQLSFLSGSDRSFRHYSLIILTAFSRIFLLLKGSVFSVFADYSFKDPYSVCLCLDCMSVPDSPGAVGNHQFPCG